MFLKTMFKSWKTKSFHRFVFKFVHMESTSMKLQGKGLLRSQSHFKIHSIKCFEDFTVISVFTELQYQTNSLSREAKWLDHKN